MAIKDSTKVAVPRKPRPKVGVQEKTKGPEPYVQQTHRDCGGIIVAVARSGEAALACRTCETVWEIALPFIGCIVTSTVPNDWSGDWKREQAEGGAK